MQSEATIVAGVVAHGKEVQNCSNKKKNWNPQSLAEAECSSCNVTLAEFSGTVVLGFSSLKLVCLRSVQKVPNHSKLTYTICKLTQAVSHCWLNNPVAICLFTCTVWIPSVRLPSSMKM